MIPTVLVFGLIAGILAQRVRTLSVIIFGFSLAWAAGIAFGLANDWIDVAGAFGLAALNATLGALAGRAIRLLGLLVQRLGPAR